jgi:hypothetical protein
MAKKVNRPKIQHYVSQFQLRNFADERGQVQVFDKVEGRIFTLSPHGIAAEAGFYDFTDQAGKPHTVEHLLGKMETQVSGIIAGILDRQSLAHLTAKDRVAVSLFAAVQQRRVKAVRQRIQSLNTGILRVLDERGIDPGDVVPELDDDDVKRFSIAKLSNAKAAAKLFFDKAWVLRRAPEGKPFYISDNPITLHNLLAPRRLSLDSPGVEINLPISPSFTICFLCRTWLRLIREGLDDAGAYTHRHGYCPGDNTPLEQLAEAIATGNPDLLLPENVEHLNSLQVQYSSRFVISGTDDFELAKLMIGKNPRLKEPPGFVVY